MSAGIWVPDGPPQQITIYLDETFFDDDSGLIQVGLPIPDEDDPAFKTAVEKMRKEFPRFQHSEFKARNIEPRNAKPYGEFLRYIINLLGAISGESDLRGIVTVESSERFCGDDYKFVLGAVNKVFDQLKTQTSVAPDFARQVEWLRRHLDHLCGAPVKNPLRLIADEKFSNAKETASFKAAFSPAHGFAVLWEHSKQLATMLNALLTSARKGRWTPQFTDFRFEQSKKFLYLQAADLLANLFFNALKFEKGIRTEITQLKHDLLLTVHDGPFETSLLDALDVVTRTDSKGEVHEQLIVKDKALSGRLTLLPSSA